MCGYGKVLGQNFESQGQRMDGAHIGQALREAFGYPSFQLLMAGYFVCGFQVVFIGVHMPSYLKDHGMSPQVATYALALIGLFNVIGTYGAGALGQRMPKRYILSAIYFLWAYQRAMHGPVRTGHAGGLDLTRIEYAVLVPMMVVILFLGVYPKPVLDRINPATCQSSIRARGVATAYTDLQRCGIPQVQAFDRTGSAASAATEENH